MHKLPSMISVVLAVTVFSGCMPWATTKTPESIPTKSQTATYSTSSLPIQADPQQLAAYMAEVQKMGPLEPAAQAQLAEDLRQSEPSIWPLVVEQYWATRAYRQRMQERYFASWPQRLPPVEERTYPAWQAPEGQPTDQNYPPQDNIPTMARRPGV